MEHNWQKAFEQLKDFIAQHPEITIGSSIVMIPSEVREEFYKLFDSIETAFVKDNFPALIEKGNALGRAWKQSVDALNGQIPLESIAIAPGLRWFLNDTVDGLIRPLSDPLFEVLKGKMEIPAFEERCKHLVSNAFAAHFKEGYRRWAEVAILTQLAPDKSFRVPAIDDIADGLMGEGHENPGQHVGSVPEPVPFNKLSFEQNPIISFVVPKVVMSSKRLGRFVAMHSEFVEPYWTAQEVSRSMEWFDFGALKTDNGLSKIRPDQKFFPDLTRVLPDIVLYMADELNDIALVADHRRFARPDVCVDVFEEADWFEKGKLATVRRHHAVMKPRFGTYVICREPVPQAALDELLPKPVAATPQAEAPTIHAAGSVPEAKEQQQPAPTPEPLDIHLLGQDTI